MREPHATTHESRSTLFGKLQRASAQLPYVPRAFALVWAAARSWTLAWIALLVMQGLLPVVTVYLTRAVVDSLVAALRADGSWATVRPTPVLVALMAGLMLLTELLRSITGWMRTAQSELVQLAHGASGVAPAGSGSPPPHLAAAGARPVSPQGGGSASGEALGSRRRWAYGINSPRWCAPRLSTILHPLLESKAKGQLLL